MSSLTFGSTPLTGCIAIFAYCVYYYGDMLIMRLRLVNYTQVDKCFNYSLDFNYYFDEIQHQTYIYFLFFIFFYKKLKPQEISSIIAMILLINLNIGLSFDG